MSQTSLLATRAASPLIKPVEREIELKFQVGDPGFKATQQWPALGPPTRRPAAKRLRSVYFDTIQGDLRRHDIVLRMRNQRRGYVMTLKWSGGSLAGGSLFERGEIEVATPHDTPDLTLFGAPAARMITDATQGRALAAIYATDIKRITRLVQTDTSVIEIAFDTGAIIAGDASEAVREIELELKAGEVADLYQMGISLAAQFPVRLATQAKSDRGALLASGQMPQAARASAVLAGAATVDDVIGRAINGCLSQFIANWPAFDHGDGVSAVHQMRVAMRRLRAMLGLFHRAFACPEFLNVREDAKHIAAVLGEARDLDVFLATLRQGPQAAFPHEPGWASIITECETRRAAAYEAVGNLLSAASTTRFILSAQAFIARAGWRNGLAGEALPLLVAPAQDFAAANLTRLHKKCLRRGKHLASLAPAERHAMRIELKKLRYAADLFAPLFEHRGQIKTYLNHAGALQEQLGLVNDLCTAADIVSQLGGAETRAAGIILGWCSHAGAADDAKLLEIWRQFRKTKLFWQ